MNNKGLTLFELIGVIIIIGVIATVALPGVSQYIGRGELTTFIAYEKSMEDAAKNAVIDCMSLNSQNCEIPAKGEDATIKLSKLVKEGFIDEMKSPKGGKCDADKSYVIVNNRGNMNYKFKVCLYCDDYTTDEDYCK